MTGDVWLVPLAAGAGGASGPLLDRAIAAAVAGRDARTGGDGGRRASRRLRAVGLSVVVGVLEACAALRIGVAWSVLPVAVFLAGAAALAWCDGQYFLLPKRIQHPVALGSGTFLLLAAAAGGRWHELWVALGCGAASFLVFLAMNLVNPKAMAFGDVRLAGTVGLVVGWFGVARTIEAFVVASIAGAVVASALLATRRIGLRSHLPYGVFLAVGAVVAILA